MHGVQDLRVIDAPTFQSLRDCRVQNVVKVCYSTKMCHDTSTHRQIQGADLTEHGHQDPYESNPFPKMISLICM